MKKADIRLRAVTRSNFKIKEFKNDDMALQIQSLDLFENLVRVSFAETNDENNDREAQESTINQIIGNKQMSDYNKYVVDYSFEDELLAGLVNLLTKNRLRDRFFSSKSRQATEQSFSEPNFRHSRTGLKKEETGPVTGLKTGQGSEERSCPAFETCLRSCPTCFAFLSKIRHTRNPV